MGNKNKKKRSNNYTAKSKSVNQNKSKSQVVVTASNKVKPKEFPNSFPFWARFKKDKKRTTLVIDEKDYINKKNSKKEDGFVHREATHTYKSEYLEIKPNPDKSDLAPMYLKRPRTKPKRMFEPHNKDLDMPEDLKKRYEKNNKK